MTLYKWSQTAASNATADSTVNMAEGMAPSAVNDGVRALMASVAKYRDDTAGLLITTGSPTAFSLTSNQGFASKSAMNGAELAVTIHATNGAFPTLNIDGLGADPIIIDTVSGTTAVPNATLLTGGVYTLVYYNSGNTWRLKNFYQLPFAVPIGGMIDYFGTVAPSSNFVLPYGQAISRSTYSALFALIGTMNGSGDGSTTFNIPDLRGRVAAGKDDMGGSAASRLTTAGSSIDGATLGASGGAQNVTLASGQIPSLTSSGSNSVSVMSSVSSLAYGFTTGAVLTNGSGSYYGAGALTQMTIGSVTSSGSNSISVSYTNGAQTATKIVQPSIVCNKLLRII
ncbi:MAG: phage tail protein [bacterium]|nr:phage tail protein [bacterium]